MDNNDPTVQFQSVYDQKVGIGPKEVDLNEATEMVSKYGTAVTNDQNAYNEHRNAGTLAELNDAKTDLARAKADVTTLQAEIQANSNNAATAAEYSSGTLPNTTTAATANNTEGVVDLNPNSPGGGTSSTGGTGILGGTSNSDTNSTPAVGSNLDPSLTGTGGSDATTTNNNGGNGNDTAYAGPNNTDNNSATAAAGVSEQNPNSPTSGTSTTGGTGVLAASSLHTTSGSAPADGAAVSDTSTNSTDPQGGIGRQTLGVEGASSPTYVVKSGDNLTNIASSEGVSLHALEDANKQITDFNQIYPGQMINIPKSGNAATDGGGNIGAAAAMQQSSSPEDLVMKGVSTPGGQNFLTRMFRRK